MLSVARVSAEQAVSYFTEDNYYTNAEGVEASEWYGRGAAKLGLEGKVQANEFKALLLGKSPDLKRELLSRRSKDKNHHSRAGLDLTFSAPKSLTLASLNDERLLGAHRLAVDKALKAVEAEVALVRRGKERKVKSAGELTIAKFHHDVSRRSDPQSHPDPQIHTHCVVMNLVEDEGKYLSLHNDGVFNNSKLFGVVYQNALAQAVKELGYDISPNGNGTFEIAGYTREQIEAFSKRTAQIAKLGARTKKEERALKMGARLAKGPSLARGELRNEWLRQAREIGIDHPKPHLGPLFGKTDRSKREVIDQAIAHFAERDVGFKGLKALEFALAENLGHIASFEELKEALLKHPDIVQYGLSRTGENLYTTKEALNRETELIRHLNQGKGAMRAIASKKAIARAISSKPEGMKFTTGQEEAFRVSLSSKDQVVCWQGVAGAGKSFALKDVKEVAEASGYSFVGLAPDAEAAKVLGESAELNDSRTVASFLLSKPSGDANQVWVVDEAGKLNTRDMLSLLKRAKSEHARVILVGDTRQLSAVEAGNPFKLLQKNGVSTAFLEEHMRQKNASTALRKAVECVAKGDVAGGIALLKSECEEYRTQEARIEKLSATYLQMSPEQREKTMIISGTNRERALLTQKIRSALKKEGSLGETRTLETLKAKDLTKVQLGFASSYQQGDKVVFARDHKRLGLEKNRVYTVEKVKGAEVLCIGERGETVRFAPKRHNDTSVYQVRSQEFAVDDQVKWTKNHQKTRRNGARLKVAGIEGCVVRLEDTRGRVEEVDLTKPQYLDHALVTTSYSSQGSGADHVLFASDNTVGKESFYVAISRAKKSIKIFTDSVDGMIEKAKRSRANRNATELVEARKEGKAVRLQQGSSLEAKKEVGESVSGLVPKAGLSESIQKIADRIQTILEESLRRGPRVGKGLRERL